jgi:nicotinic acid mononucleotide adenylyltransferase
MVVPFPTYDISEVPGGNGEAFFTFGRFNPPHIGHEALIDEVKRLAAMEGKPYFIILSASCNKGWESCKKFKKQRAESTFTSCKENENPLNIEEKKKFFAAMFPGTRFITADNYGNNIFSVLGAFKRAGYTKLTGVFGEDRAPTFSAMFEKYNSPEMTVNVVGVSRDARSASATKLRTACVMYFSTYQKYSRVLEKEKKALKTLLNEQKQIIENMTKTQQITPENHKKLVNKLIKKVGNALWPKPLEEDDEECMAVPSSVAVPSRVAVGSKRTRQGGGVCVNLLKIKIRKKPTVYKLRDDEKPPKPSKKR